MQRITNIQVPAVVTEDGKIIDGKHRLEADPAWPKLVLKGEFKPHQLEIIALGLNYGRRTVNTGELRGRISRIVEDTGWTAREVANYTGVPYRTVIRYYPSTEKRSGGYKEPDKKPRKKAASPRREMPTGNSARCPLCEAEVDGYDLNMSIEDMLYSFERFTDTRERVKAWLDKKKNRRN